MGHYRSNLRDLEFNLFEVFRAQDALGRGPFADMAADQARDVLREVERLATTDIAASYQEGDRNPPVFDPDDGTVTLPEPVKESYKAYLAGEWYRLQLPQHLGGLGASPSLEWACAELVLGANPAVFLYACGPSFAAVIDALGTPEQQDLARTMIERQWGATMVLTEPDAGSDVGASRTRAMRQPDGNWHLSGVKRFITAAEWDVPENIVHLVLARPDGAAPGTKGLSLFIVPKHLVDTATGALGARNGVYVTNVEKKMGLTASATCELTFGDRHPAVGYLLGDVHDGMAQMFRIIEHARMMVGTKAMAALSTGYLTALAFARTRLQGTDLTRIADPAAPRVPISAHPDVRRMLMLQKAYAEGLRALVLYSARVQDDAALARDRGAPDDSAERLADLLLPIVKGFGSEKAFELLALSLQVLGGSGYLRDYPVEQYLRDAKVDTLYEGTTTIQGMDLFFRKVVRDRARTLTALLAEIRRFDTGGVDLAPERARLATAVTAVQGLAFDLLDFRTAARDDVRSIYRVGLNTTRLLMAVGDLVVGWLLLRQAGVALDALPTASRRDRHFYSGKVAAARFFAAERLPLLTVERAIAHDTTLALMELDAAAF